MVNYEIKSSNGIKGLTLLDEELVIDGLFRNEDIHRFYRRINIDGWCVTSLINDKNKEKNFQISKIEI